MTRHHRRAHVWLWLAAVAVGGAAWAAWVVQLRGAP
jgi:NO-binding membrane sensor protein with MHYT domain